MAAARGGQAKPPAPKPKPQPKVVPGTRGGAVIPPKAAPNPWIGLGHEGGGLTTPAPAAPPPPVVAPPPPDAPPLDTMGTINWAAVLGLDPGYTAAKAAADAQIANLQEQFDGQTNPFSTIKQLQLSMGQNIRSNANAHAAHGTLFGGGTAQGAINANRDNQRSRYDATNVFNQNVGQQNQNKAQALSDATGRVLANPKLYGLNTTAPDEPPPPDAPPANAPAAPATPSTPTTPFVTAKQLAINPRAAQTKKNNRY